MSGAGPWQALTRLPAWRVTEIPRDADPGGGVARDTGAAQRFQALASASAGQDAVAVAWIRERAGGPVAVLAAGQGLAGGQDAGQAVLCLPPGARGTAVAPGETAAMLAAVPCWTRVCGFTDVLRAERSQPEGKDGGPSLEDGLLSAWLDAFAWLLLAEPLAAGDISDLAARAAHEQLEAENFRSPSARLAARRAGAWHEELRDGITAGMWRVHLLAGAATPADAGRVARLLCASVDLRGLPYGLTARRDAGSLRDTLAAASGNGYLPAPVAAGAPAGDRSWWDSPMYLQTPAGHDAAAAQRTESWAGAAAAGLRGPARMPGAERDAPVPSAPFTASSRLVAALARVPARELPGLTFRLRPQFDVTPETACLSAGPAVVVGTVLDWNRVPAGPLAVPLPSLNRHVFVCGATGAGKSQTIRNLLEHASGAGIQWLVVEPAKAEYRLMAARLPGAQVIVIRPGDLHRPAAGINPLEPAPGPDGARFPLQTHADLLRALFLAAFQADEPFPQVLAAALTRCYEQAGWDLVTGQPAVPGIRPSYPGLEDLQSAAMTVVDEIGYGREVRDNVRGFVQVRIGSLRLGTTGRFLDGAHPVDFGALLGTNVVLEIEDAGDDQDKAFLMGAVLVRLIEHLRLRSRQEGPGTPRLRHLTVIEEAHRLLRQPSPGATAGAAAHATEMFADLLAEIRAYGEGLIIAEQIPAKLISDVIKNTAVKIVHRLPAADDRQAVGATMNLSDAQSSYLVTLPPGEAAVHADGMDSPLLARVPDGTSRETGAATASSAEPVITPRSLTCGNRCQAAPCTLAQMRAAQRAVITDPRITLWAELAVVAHLTGWPSPRPAATFSSDLRAMDSPLLDCALSHAVDTAVAVRVPAIIGRVSPAGLAVHVTAVLRQQVTSPGRACEAEEPGYLAPPWQWILVRDALREACASGTSGPHPSSAGWEHDYRRQVPGASCEEQLRAVHRWHTRAQRDTASIRTALWGTRPHTAIEQAAGSRLTDDDWAAQLADALDALTGTSWTQNLLTAAPGPEHKAASG